MKPDTKKEIVWRGKLNPTFVLPCTQPSALTSAQVRRTVDEFLETGKSNHGPYGGTLWALIDYLQRKGIPYSLTAYPGHGYEVMKAPLVEIWNQP